MRKIRRMRLNKQREEQNQPPLDDENYHEPPPTHYQPKYGGPGGSGSHGHDNYNKNHHYNNMGHDREFMRPHLEQVGPIIDATRSRGRQLITHRRSQAPPNSIFSDAVEKFNGLMHKLNSMFDNLTDGVGVN